MAIFEIEWTLSGTAAIEADDTEEAEQILNEGLGLLDTTMLEEFEVQEVIVDAVTERRGR